MRLLFLILLINYSFSQNSDFDERYVEKVGDNMTGDLTLGTDKITLDAGSGSITSDGSATFASSVEIKKGDKHKATRPSNEVRFVHPV